MIDPGPRARALDDEARLRTDIARILRVLLPFAVLGVAAVVAQGGACASARVAAVATALLAAGAAALAGALAGLLFGIPRSLSGAAAAPAAPAAPPAGAAHAHAGEGYAGNSNLEQISDWLTKIIVGATLVQARQIFEALRGLAAGLGGGLCGPAPTAMAGALLAGAGIWGFFLGYLLTRRALPAMLRRGEEEGRPTAQEEAAIGEAIDQLTSSRRPTDLTAQQVRSQHPGSQAAATRLARFPLAEVAPGDQAAWARAQMLLGNYAQAVRGLESAVAVNPGDPGLVEDLMFAALYLPPPTGFERALRAGEGAGHRTPKMEVYLAAAYGQKHRWEKGKGVAPEQLRDLRDRAFHAARAAIQADASWRSLLAAFLEPRGSEDDDLETFHDDPEFRALLGVDAAAQAA